MSTLFGKLDNRESQEQVFEIFKLEIESHRSEFCRRWLSRFPRDCI